MAINLINSANTFDHWLTSTQSLISITNSLTDGPLLIANTALDIDGGNAQLNVRSQGSINTFYANVANIANISFSESNVSIPGNVATLNVTSETAIGGNVVIHQSANIVGNIITNNLTVFGQTNSAIGFISVGNSSFGNVNVNSTLITKEFEFSNANGISINVSGNVAINGTANIARVEGGLLNQFQESIIAFSLTLG
jgi:hypothetical protein